MFEGTPFNQDVSLWDVSNVINMRAMFNMTPFNFDLSSWNVENVTECLDFDRETSAWILPKPNFTNCNPG